MECRTMKYKFINDRNGNVYMVFRAEDNSCIPFDLDNTDYQRFKSDLANGVELKDADGNVMTSEQITEFLESLP